MKNFQLNTIQPKIPRLKEYLKFFLGVPLTAVSFFFIAKFIYSGKGEILPQIFNFKSLPFALGIFFLILFFLFRSLVWKELLKNEGHAMGIAESTYLLANAEIKRYIPGSILSFIARIHFFNSFEIPRRRIIKLILYESALFVITSALISVPAIFYFFPSFRILIAPVLLILVVTVVIFLKRNIPLNRFEKPFILMIFAWIFYGLGNYLISNSFVYIDPSRILETSSFFVLAWLVGYLVLIVPMGLGVREGVVTFGLFTLMPISLAATVALTTRIIFVFSEVLFLVLSYLTYRFIPYLLGAGFIKTKLKIENHLLILWVSIASYITYFTYYSFQRHANFFTGRFDLGNMDQTVWNTLSGRIFQLTNPDGTSTIPRLAIHADFILILLSPFYLIWNDPRMLLFIQTVILGVGAYFVYLIANHVLKNNSVSTILGISYLLNPFVQKQNLFDFHAVVLATTFLLGAFYCTQIKKYKFFFLFLILAVLTKENIYLIGSIFGLYLAYQTKNKKWLFLTLANLLIFYVLISKLIPMSRGGQHFATEYFAEFGDTPPAILISLIFNPLKTASSLLSQSNLNYLYSLFLPVGLLSFLAPLTLILALPDLAINLLSKNENLKNLTFHYAATIVPFVYISAIYGLKRVFDLRIKFVGTKFIAFILIIFSLYASYEYGALPGAKNPSLEIYTRSVSEKNEIKRFLKLIPQDISVAATNNLGAQLSHRTRIYTVPYGLDEADVVVFLLNDPYAQPSLSDQREYARNLQNNPSYIEIYRAGDFIALSKRSAAGKIPPPY